MAREEREERDKKSLEKFSEKYGYEYEITYSELITDSLDFRSEIHVHIDELMDEGETAIVYSMGTNEAVETYDNLFGFIIRPDYEKSVLDIVKTVLPEAKVFVSYMSSSFNNSLTKESTLQDAYAAGESVRTQMNLIARTNLDEASFKKAIDSICETLKNAKLNGLVTSYAVIDEEEYNGITRTNFKEKVNAFAKNAKVQMPFNVYNCRSI